ncbi:MAG: BREX system P-loop protein BrxC [Chloroflexales bacterium]
MLIRETFATTIQQRIEPVVKVVDRRPAVILGEIRNLVVTPQWERYLRSFLDSYSDAADRTEEQGIGLWVSGFFGSGKSLLVKVLGTLLEGHDLDAQSVHDIFLSRLPANSPDRAPIARYLQIIKRKLTTTIVGGNLHAMQATRDDALALITFKLFAYDRGFTQNWPLAWAVEYQIDERSKTIAFRQRVAERSGVSWDQVSVDPEFYLEDLYAAASETLPEHFREDPAAVERAVTMVAQRGITPVDLIGRLRRWCEARDGGGRRHKLLIQLDELGQWISGGPRTERAQQVQALIETAATSGNGRIWIAVTAHGDVQALRSSLQQEEYAKINQRFGSKCKLSNEDISLVVEERILRKTQPARAHLMQRFTDRSGDLTDMGTVQGHHEYPTPDPERFALFYPYLPWTVAVIPDVVKGIAQASGRDEALTGSNRTMIAVVQGAIIETPGLLEGPVGRLLCLADLYDQLSTDAPIETKTDLNRVRESVPGATDFTPRVARALYMLGEAEYIPPTLDHIARALVDSLEADLAAVRARAKVELDRLVEARYAKRVGDEYTFLNTQQRGFQDKVRDKADELQYKNDELIEALKGYESDDYLRFDQPTLEGREIKLKLELDNRVVRNTSAYVSLRVFSPFQRALDTQLGNDAAMRQRSNESPDAIVIRLDDVPGLRATLALAMATEAVAQEVTSSAIAGEAEKDVARQARKDDLQSHKAEVRRLLGQSVRGARLFFRGTTYDPTPSESPGAAIRATLAEIVPQLYARFSDVPYKITNEETAVKAALAGNTTNNDLRGLGVYRADGTLNDAHPLLSALRSRLPIDDQYQQFVQADTLRSDIERPPFGWDPNTVKVGLALLLRASACRLIDNSRTLMDPADNDVILALTKEAKFRNLRVQGVRSDLTMDELRAIRGYIEALFTVNPRPALQQASLNNVLGEKLNESARQAQSVQSWAVTARCLLPIAFESGSSLVTELLNNGSPQARLPRFKEQADTLVSYHELLRGLVDFQREHGAEFVNIREFYTGMVNAETNIPEVGRFIGDWRVVTTERSVTDPQRWNEVVRSFQAAQQALTAQAASWRQQAQDTLTSAESGLRERLRTVGVPDEALDDEIAGMSPIYTPIRERLSAAELSFTDARGALTALAGADAELRRRVAELREKYRPVVVVERRELRLRWADMVSAARIESDADLEQVLEALRRRLQAQIDDDTALILE